MISNAARVLLAIPFFLHVTPLAEYRCDVNMKVDPDGFWSEEQIEVGQWHILIRDTGSAATISRCSFSPSQQKITCDLYQVDRIEVDPAVKIKKYYYFRGQFDVQVFPNLTFIANDGRGTISYGTCRVIAP